MAKYTSPFQTLKIAKIHKKIRTSDTVTLHFCCNLQQICKSRVAILLQVLTKLLHLELPDGSFTADAERDNQQAFRLGAELRPRFLFWDSASHFDAAVLNSGEYFPLTQFHKRILPENLKKPSSPNYDDPTMLPERRIVCSSPPNRMSPNRRLSLLFRVHRHQAHAFLVTTQRSMHAIIIKLWIPKI